ncbi:MAG: hypothetical protein HS113_19695 [Verrucomicrobiales bacterium]|nr:hypothetical protein [Verrucomicrobiales bacterium]
MKLPGAARAEIDPRKLEEYCLSFDHPRGKHKARVFRSALGLTTENAAEVEVRIREALETEPCTAGAQDKFGRRYAVDFRWEREGKTAAIRTTWIIRADEDCPRLTSCYVL